MNDRPIPNPVEPSASSLSELAEAANSQLVDRVDEATHQAFNLGCLIGLLPAVVFGIVIFLASGFSLIGTAMAIVIGIISAIAFANLAAMITRRNTLNRTYRDTVNPEIERSLREAGATREDFDKAARDILSPTAPLFSFVRLPEDGTPDLPEGES